MRNTSLNGHKCLLRRTQVFGVGRGSLPAAPLTSGTPLQRVWLCTEAVGLVRADRIVSMTVNNWRVSGARAEETADDGDDVLSAALVDGTKVILGYCGTSLGWRALADLAATMERAAEEAAAARDVTFVFAGLPQERLSAAIDGVDEWARADALPTEEEISRIRRLINRIKGDITQLTNAERAQIDEAITVIRKHRAVNLGMPSIRLHPASPTSEALP